MKDGNITDPATFCGWWQLRNLPHDRTVLKAAIDAGLVSRGGGMISLTLAGRTLREGHILNMRKAALRADLEAKLKELDA